MYLLGSSDRHLMVFSSKKVATSFSVNGKDREREKYGLEKYIQK